MRRLLGAATMVLLVAGCGSEGAPDVLIVEGIVVAVDGDLATVGSFTIVDQGGTSFTFVPAEGLTFDGGPLSHMSAHVTSGEPVAVGYETDEDGRLIAVSVEDA